MIDLTDETAAAILSIEQRHINRMAAEGVPTHVAKPAEGKHLWGIMKVSPDGPTQFFPDPDGREAYVSISTRGSDVTDLIAWHPANPANWRWRIGDEPFLGIDAFERCWPGDGPLQIHATPLDFLRAGGEGLVVLDWNATSDIRRLAMVDAIAAPRSIVERIDKILRRPVRMPRWKVMEAPRAAA